MFCAFSGPGSVSNSLMYHYGNGKAVHSPSPNTEELKRDSASYSTFKLPNTSFTSTFFDGTNSSTDPWSSSSGISPSGHGGMLGSSPSNQSQSGNYGNLPTHDCLNLLQSSAVSAASKRLPPMTYFHRGNGSASLFLSSPHTVAASTTDRSMGGQENLAADPHTGNALGKALASIYSPDHTSSSFPPSSSTPGRSLSPLAASTVSAGGSQWHRSAGQKAQPSNYENSLQSLIEDKLDRLDDAIHILRNHAVGGTNITLTNDMHNLLGQSQNGPITMRPNYPISGLVISGLPTDVSADAGEAAHLAIHPSAVPSASHRTNPEDSFRGSVKVEPTDGEQLGLRQAHPNHRPHSTCLSQPSSDGLHSDAESDTREPETPNADPASRNSSVHDDEELSPEQKAERERERRMANNARERLRVRDINEAFKELGRMVQLHLKSDKPQTKLLILHQAVAVILRLEQQVRERNLNPKAACLRRREEEKVSALTLDPQAMHTIIHSALPDQGNSLSGHH
ncbi:transcription factor 12-like isoform X2 [Electrophorus electricus]|uniref:transcription factor 12-like isoform X2 n=1 Tax=Electrophorus electricus TaxID=8005 RepID=UPI0015CFF9D0|nr:transcription factor 12-like isoform X2 [Electrophorus electricus]